MKKNDDFIKLFEILYGENEVIIFKDIEKAIRYRGDKVCLFNGDVNFGNFKIGSLGKLRAISGGAYFRNSKIKSLDNLRYIGTSADFRNSEIDDLGGLKSIGNEIYYNKNQKSLAKELKVRNIIK